MSLGRVLVNEPRAFPGALGKVAKRSVRTLWDARGGGLYACGFVLTFIGLEIRSLFDGIVSSSGAGAFFGEQLFQIFFRFTIDSLQNTMLAFLWPAFAIEWSPMWGGAMLAVLYVVFPRFIKKRVESWLFHDDDTPPAAPQDPDVRH